MFLNYNHLITCTCNGQKSDSQEPIKVKYAIVYFYIMDQLEPFSLMSFNVNIQIISSADSI